MHFGSHYRWLVVTKYLKIELSPHSVLDVGCYDGYFLSKIEARVKVAVDIDPPPIEKQYFPVMIADACSPPFRREVFNNIFAFDVIEHIQDDTTFLESLVSLLSKDGALWLSTPTSGSKIFPHFLTDRAERIWGHVRKGYSTKDIREKMPQGVKLSFIYWNAPFFRSFYIPLKLISTVSPTLARKGTELCAWLDSIFPKGTSGQIFVRVVKEI